MKLILLWKAGVFTNMLYSYMGTMRSLVVITSMMILSAGNDLCCEGMNHYWGLPFNIFNISLLRGRAWVTSGEDQSVRK